MPDLSTFKQPVSRCLKPSTNLIISQDGNFKVPYNNLPPAEIVATSRPDTDPHDDAQIDDAAIQIYGAGCQLIYFQQFPKAGEVTFDTIHWSGLTLLHLVTISEVGEPADDEIYNHIILVEHGDGSFSPVQPFSLQGDKGLSIFIGDIGEGKGFGIVETVQLGLINPPGLTSPFSYMFQLKDVQLEEGQTTFTFVGPTVIRAPRGANAQDAWPDTSYATGFPLTHYLYGKWGGG